MATIVVKAQNCFHVYEILKKVYNADPSASYTHRGANVHGSVLLARSRDLETCSEVEISSDYYTEETLREMFDPGSKKP